MTRSGKVIYYDAHAGKHYDPDTDLYIDYDDYQRMNNDYDDYDLAIEEAVLPSDNLPSDGVGSDAPVPGAQTGADPAQQAQTGVTNDAGDLQALVQKLNEPEVADALKTITQPEVTAEPEEMAGFEGDEITQLKDLLGLLK